MAGRTDVGVLLIEIDEVLFAEAALRLGARGHRLGQRHRDARLVAGEDLGAVEVAAIGYRFDAVLAMIAYCLPSGELRAIQPLFVTSWAMMRWFSVSTATCTL